ncbi:MAG: M48 family metallopeptidase [Alphaproteobacteria bacterium]|nr:M48 family metallopeptidase [Alphaproteobacteria bacterium]
MIKAGEDRRILELDGREVALRVRRNSRARRLSLRVDTIEGEAVLTLPSATPVTEGISFAKRKSGWLVNRLNAVPPRVPFADGAAISVLGQTCTIRHAPDAGRVVICNNGEILVSGRPEHLARRLTDWLKREARRELSERATQSATQIDRKPGCISVRDTRSRWGSCSATGNLSFSWRLIMAPEFVLHYVVDHEVAHLIEKNHGPRFWKLVNRLNDQAKTARTWLRKNGETLHRIG